MYGLFWLLLVPDESEQMELEEQRRKRTQQAGRHLRLAANWRTTFLFNCPSVGTLQATWQKRK